MVLPPAIISDAEKHTIRDHVRYKYPTFLSSVADAVHSHVAIDTSCTLIPHPARSLCALDLSVLYLALSALERAAG